MRFILEHHWAASLSISAIAGGLLWVGLRENLLNRVKIGLGLLFVAIGVWCIGFFIVTPREHARRVVTSFVQAVIEQNIPLATKCIATQVILVDDWKGKSGSGSAAVIESIRELHKKHTLTQSTILKCEPLERTGDVQVDLVLFARVSGIGSIPSSWRIFVDESESGDWQIYSIEAIEIAGRSFR